MSAAALTEPDTVETRRIAEIFRVCTDGLGAQASAAKILRAATLLIDAPLAWFVVEGPRGRRILATCANSSRLARDRLGVHATAPVPLPPDDRGVLYAFDSAERRFRAAELEVAYLAAERIAVEAAAQRQGGSVSWADADGLLAPAAMAAVTGVVARRALVEHARMAVVAFPDSPLVRSTFVRLSARAEVAGRWRNRLLAMLLAEDAVSFAQQVAAPRHAILMTRGALHGAPLLEDAAALLSGSC